MENTQALGHVERVRLLGEAIQRLVEITEQLKPLRDAGSLSELMPTKWYPTAMMMQIAIDALWVAERQMSDIRTAQAAAIEYPF